jgi:uncharacterized membrane protein
MARKREICGLLGTAAIFGRPVHPMIALYPVSLLTTAIAAIPDVTAWAGGKLSYTHMAGVKGHGGQHMDREKRYVA